VIGSMYRFRSVALIVGSVGSNVPLDLLQSYPV